MKRVKTTNGNGAGTAVLDAERMALGRIGAAVAEDRENVRLKPINKAVYTVWIRGTTSIVHHRWASKAIQMILDKKQGKKAKVRENCDPVAECEAATHRDSQGRYSLPVSAIKKAIINAAHKDIGIEKVLVRKALFIVCDDPTETIPMECEPPVMREDMVRVGNGAADLRFRPEFARGWRARLVCEVDADLLDIQTLITLINRAGFGVGLLEGRPEKGGDWGRFEVDRTEPYEQLA